MAEPPTSQGSGVTFAGVPFGRLRSWRVQPGTATFDEWTHVGSTVIGTGPNARVVKQYACTAIEPGGVDIGLYGCPPLNKVDIGRNGSLTVLFDGGSIALDAYLEDFDVSGSVGEFLVGTAKFKFSGTNWST